MLIRKTKTTIAFFASITVFLFVSFSLTFGSERTLSKILKTIEKDYYVILLGLTLGLPEVDKLELSDNGTFTLTSDLWDEPARGTYEKNIFLIKGEGITSIFYDQEWEELMKIKYSFTGFMLGLRGFFILGTGLREFTFLQDNSSSSEKIIFMGPGFGFKSR